MKTRLMKRGLGIAMLLALGACASGPKGPPPEIVRLQGDLSRLHSDPRVATNAPEELRRADVAVSNLAMESRHLDRDMYEHGVYLADRLVKTAEAEGLGRYAEVHMKDLGIERERLIVESRTRQLGTARAAAENAQRQAEAERIAAAQARGEAAVAREDAMSAREEVESMRLKLADLQTQETARGLVVTLGDVLFEVDRAELKPGATRKIDSLVDALNSNPGTTIVIEGHTDSTGAHDHNVELSRARAEAVQAYLTSHGIASSRVVARGMGPDYPVASNDSPDGRQQNRRVEVVVQTNVGVNRR